MSDQESINILNSLIPPLNLNNLNGVQLNTKSEQINDSSAKCPVQHQSTAASNPSVNNVTNTNLSLSNGCPFFKKQGNHQRKPISKNPEWQTSISVASQDVPYEDYLCLDKILNAQYPLSKKYGKMAHDEHLFIVVHQAYELWFKQIIFELDSIMDLLGKSVVDDRCLLVIVSRIQRINMICKVKKNNKILKLNQLKFK
jgi:hypothetical protein